MALPIIPWIGGKRRLADKILPMFPEHKCYVEPFAGAAALLMLKEPSRTEVLNDVHSELVNLYRVVKHHLEPFIQEFKRSLVSREMFEWAKISPPRTLTDIQRAARFYYLQRQAFGGKVSDQRFGYAPSSPPRLNLLRIEEDLSEAHLRLARVYIEHLDWLEVIHKYDRDYTLFYCDPPYWKTAGYGVDFGLEQYQLLSERARSIKGKMIISLNDHPDMREIFQGLTIKTTQIQYTVGGGGRGGKVKEMIIRNF